MQPRTIGINHSHYTPQQLSKLINLHIKTQQCVSVKCHDEKQQLLNTIAKMAKHFYDVYSIHEKQQREMNKIVNIYNDFCAQFALPNKLEPPNQHEFARIDKIAHMVYDHFIKHNESNNKHSARHSSTHLGGFSTDSTLSTNGVISSSNLRIHKPPSTSSIIALENKLCANVGTRENRKRKIAQMESKETANDRSLICSVTANNGSTQAPLSSSFSPSTIGPPLYLSPNKQQNLNACQLMTPPAPTTLMGNGLIHPWPQKQLNSSQEHTTEMIADHSKTNGHATMSFSPTNNNLMNIGTQNKKIALLAPSPIWTISPDNNAQKRQKMQPHISIREMRRKMEAEGFIEGMVANSIANFEDFHEKSKVNNGGTALVEEGQELSLGLISSFQPPKSRPPSAMVAKKPAKERVVVIQLDDDED